MSSRRVDCTTIILCTMILLIAHIGIAGWGDVEPGIQSPESNGPSLPLEQVVVVYTAESSKDIAYELGNQLAALNADVLGIISEDEPWPPIPEETTIFYVSQWADWGYQFESLEYEPMQTPPPPDGYYIYAISDSADSSCGKVLVTASDLRGLLYATVSIAKAAENGQGRLESGRIVDWPNFTDRLVWNDISFVANGVYPQEAWQRSMADSLLRFARDGLVSQKATGMIHPAGSRFYDDAYIHAHNIDTVLAYLGRGRSDHPWNDRWQDFHLDWFEGIDWRASISDNNERVYFRRIRVRTTCEADTVIDPNWITLNPKPLRPTYFFEYMTADSAAWDLAYNGDFDDFNGAEFRGWKHDEFSSWIQETESNNNFCRITRQSWPETYLATDLDNLYLEPGHEIGPPARQMVLSFRIRKPDSVTVKVQLLPQYRLRHRQDPDTVQVPTIDDLQTSDFTSQSDLDEFINDSTVRMEMIRDVKVPNTGNQWMTVRFLFYTYGTTAARLKFSVIGSANSSMDLDDVEIHDGGFYDVARGDIYSESADSFLYWDSKLMRYHRDTNGNITDSSETSYPVHFSERQTLYGSGANWHFYDAAAFVSRSAIPTDSMDYWDSLVVEYWSRMRKGTALFSVDNNGIRDYRADDFEARTDSASLFTPPMTEHMQWFENKYRHYGLGALLSGFGCSQNEFKCAGWMPNEVGRPLQEVYGEFLQAMYEELPQRPDSSAIPRPLYLLADMFGSGIRENAKRFTRTNNPYGGGRGWLRPEPDPHPNSIPGMSTNGEFVYMPWHILDEIGQDTATVSVDFWRDIGTLPESNQGVLLTIHANYPEGWPFPPYEGAFHDILDAAHENNENGSKFRGGCIYWSPDAGFTRFYPYNSSGNPYGRGQWLQWLWKCTPLEIITEPFDQYYAANQSQASITLRAYPVPYRLPDMEAEIDSVVLQYRFNFAESWSTISLPKSSDSLYTFSLNLPDSGGVCEYRTWAFDDWGAYGSIPGRGTKWSKPDEGERGYFTFEKRNGITISTAAADTFYTPGIITRLYQIEPMARLVIKPLPGFKQSTLYVADTSGITVPYSGQNELRWFEVAGNDSQTVRIAFAPGSDAWKGITGVTAHLTNVIFDTGEPIELPRPNTGNYNVLHNAVFNDLVTFADSAEVSGDATFAGARVDSGVHLTILPNSQFTFTDTARFVVAKGAYLTCAGTDSLPVVFQAQSDTMTWQGIHISKDEAEDVVFENCEIKNAIAGMTVDHASVLVDNCDFTDCDAGILAINGGQVEMDSCTVSGNDDGIVALNLSTIRASNSTIAQNTGPGITAFSRSTIYLEDCAVDSNGGDGKAGGIGLFTGSSGFLKCTKAETNTGPGIAAYGGALIMSSVDPVGAPLTNWRSNSVLNNETVDGVGQISLAGRVGFSLYGGHNRIADSSASGDLVHWEDQPTRDWWRDVYWGTTDTSEILSRLPNNVLLGRVDSAWSECSAFCGDSLAPDSIVSVFLDPHNLELSEDWNAAKSGYRAIIQSTPKSDFALAAADRLLALNMLTGTSFDSTRIYLQCVADTTTNLPLRRWLTNTIAGCWSEVDSFSLAKSQLDTLADTTSVLLDEVNARAQSYMVNVRELSGDLENQEPATVLAYADSARLFLDRLRIWTQTDIYDTVVMYAPCTVKETIMIHPNGRLEIRPLPGVRNAEIRVENGAYFNPWWNGFGHRGQMVVQGESDCRVVLNCVEWGWSLIYSAGGYVELANTVMFGEGICADMEDVTGSEPVLKVDSCEFALFDDGLWLLGTDTSSYIRDSRLHDMGSEDWWGAGWGASITCIGDNHIRVENCVIDNGKGIGVLGVYGGNAEITGTEIDSSAGYGIMVMDGSTFTIDCSEISTNGDSLPEVWATDGLVDLVGAHTLISDSTGTLIYSADPSYVDLGDGENGLELRSEDGMYIESGDTTITWDITLNNWSPADPTDSTFYDYLFPHNPAKWLVDTSLSSFLACGEGSSASIAGGSIIVRGDNEGHSDSYGPPVGDLNLTAIRDNVSTDLSKALRPGISKTNDELSKSNVPTTTKQTNRAEILQRHHREQEQWRAIKQMSLSDKKTVADAVVAFVNEHPSSALIPAALTRAASLASKETAGLAEFLGDQAKTQSSSRTRTLARRLSFMALAKEGQPGQALRGLEEMIETATTPRDSIKALVSATGVYFVNRNDKQVQPRNRAVICTDRREFVKRTIALGRMLNDPTLGASRHNSAIPTEYRLYQNFPNPFNPITEIRFDLPEAVRVELKIFNVLGQEVAKLVDDVRPAGAYNIQWDSRNVSGVSVASGMYVYQLKAGKFTDAKKMILLR